MTSDHTFVVRQSVSSEVLLSTSTPNDYIASISKKYDIPLFVHSEHRGVVSDWNNAITHAKTKYVTVVHQDDLYGRR